MESLPQTLTLHDCSFAVVKLLGKGKSGYSYLVEEIKELEHAKEANATSDTDAENRLQYVLKQIHHEPCDYYTFGDKLGAELYAYDRLTACGVPMPRLLDSDRETERLLKEYIPGPTVLDMVVDGTLPPACMEQMEALCTRLYANNLNIDYFPTNFVLHKGTLYYVDYECNPYMEQWDFAHWGIHYWSMTPTLQEYLANRK